MKEPRAEDGKPRAESHEPRATSGVNMAIEVAGIRMQNPLLTASGTFGYAQEFERYLDLNRLGGLVVKTITRLPRPGNPAPRITETPAGMLNAIGLLNVGIDVFIREKLPYLRTLAPPLIVNVAGESAEDFRELTKRISVRAIDFEFQQWPKWLNSSLAPYGASVGVGYKIF